MHNAVRAGQVGFFDDRSINRCSASGCFEIQLLTEYGLGGDIRDAETAKPWHFSGSEGSLGDVMLDDVYQTLVIFRKEERCDEIRRQFFERLIGRREGRVESVHILEGFPLTTRRDGFGENREASIFLETLKKIVRRRGQYGIDQINHAIGTGDRLRRKPGPADDLILVIDGNELPRCGSEQSELF